MANPTVMSIQTSNGEIHLTKHDVEDLHGTAFGLYYETFIEAMKDDQIIEQSSEPTILPYVMKQYTMEQIEHVIRAFWNEEKYILKNINLYLKFIEKFDEDAFYEECEYESIPLCSCHNKKQCPDEEYNSDQDDDSDDFF